MDDGDKVDACEPSAPAARPSSYLAFFSDDSDAGSDGSFVQIEVQSRCGEPPLFCYTKAHRPRVVRARGVAALATARVPVLMRTFPWQHAIKKVKKPTPCSQNDDVQVDAGESKAPAAEKPDDDANKRSQWRERTRQVNERRVVARKKPIRFVEIKSKDQIREIENNEQIPELAAAHHAKPHADAPNLLAPLADEDNRIQGRRTPPTESSSRSSTNEEAEGSWYGRPPAPPTFRPPARPENYKEVALGHRLQQEVAEGRRKAQEVDRRQQAAIVNDDQVDANDPYQYMQNWSMPITPTSTENPNDDANKVMQIVVRTCEGHSCLKGVIVDVQKKESIESVKIKIAKKLGTTPQELQLELGYEIGDGDVMDDWKTLADFGVQPGWLLRATVRPLDKPWNDQRTSLLSGQAIQNSVDKPFPGSRFSWDKPSVVVGLIK